MNNLPNKNPYHKPVKKPETKKLEAVKTPDTSWGGVAEWYDSYLETNPDSYQEKVIAPNLLRLLDIKKGMKVLDLACGQGFFSRKFKALGADVVGVDISKELIITAKKHSQGIEYVVSPAHQISFLKDASFNVITIVLAIQNIEEINEVFAQAKRVLVKGGRLIMVLNHPTFRVPKRSDWGFDPRNNTQYRRVEGYLSRTTNSIVMNPGIKNSKETISYHRSLQDFFKALSKHNLVVTRLEEWISHKKSQTGPRQKAEDLARKEIPLFMMLEATKI